MITQDITKKILYVEDNEDTADAVRIMLNREGYFAEVAYTGKDGLKKANEKEYHLILLDIMLPDMSGWDVFMNLRKTTDTKYAFLSAIPISQQRLQQIGRAGVSSYIQKPFTRKMLIDEVKYIFTNRQDKIYRKTRLRRM